MRTHAILAASLLLAACHGEENELVGHPPTDDQPSANVVGRGPHAQTIKVPGEDPEQSTRDEYPDPIFTAQTFPFAEPESTFQLTWDGGTSTLPVFDEPDPDANQIGKKSWKQGERIRWTDTFVEVFAPTVYHVSRSTRLEGPVWTQGYLTGDEDRSFDLSPGQPVAVYLYAGEGLCWVGVARTIIKSVCPDQKHFLGPFGGKTPAATYQPQRKLWWVQVGEGWVPLDDRVLVDLVSP